MSGVLNVRGLLDGEKRAAESLIMDATVYVYLEDEGTDVWRPASASRRGDVYTIMGPVPEGERWRFPPGTRVRCRSMWLEGKDVLVAHESVSPDAA